MANFPGGLAPDITGIAMEPGFKGTGPPSILFVTALDQVLVTTDIDINPGNPTGEHDLLRLPARRRSQRGSGDLRLSRHRQQPSGPGPGHRPGTVRWDLRPIVGLVDLLSGSIGLERRGVLSAVRQPRRALDRLLPLRRRPGRHPGLGPGRGLLERQRGQRLQPAGLRVPRPAGRRLGDGAAPHERRHPVLHLPLERHLRQHRLRRLLLALEPGNRPDPVPPGRHGRGRGGGAGLRERRSRHGLDRLSRSPRVATRGSRTGRSPGTRRARPISSTTSRPGPARTSTPDRGSTS